MISYLETLNDCSYLGETYYTPSWASPSAITMYGIPIVEWTKLLKLPNAVDVYYDGSSTLYPVIAGKTNIPKVERRK